MDLEFPRVIYRGLPDLLGAGTHVHAESGAVVGETKHCQSAADLEDHLKIGWRLTRELVEDAAAIEELKVAKAKK